MNACPNPKAQEVGAPGGIRGDYSSNRKESRSRDISLNWNDEKERVVLFIRCICTLMHIARKIAIRTDHSVCYKRLLEDMHLDCIYCTGLLGRRDRRLPTGGVGTPSGRLGVWWIL
jgi:hypothetical protein